LEINGTAAEPVPATVRTTEDGTAGDGRKVNQRGNWSRMEEGTDESESPTRGESPRRRKQEKWNGEEGRMEREERRGRKGRGVREREKEREDESQKAEREVQ
jgi:hypothetical protein